MQHSSKCFKSVGLTEKFKENSCKLVLYVINETFHSYVNIKRLAIFSAFFPLSSYWASRPWPPLCICLFYRRVGGLVWGHILLRGRINSWVLWLIQWTNSCSPSNSPLLGCPSHPRRGAARRPCLPRLLKLSALSCWKCPVLGRHPVPVRGRGACEPPASGLQHLLSAAGARRMAPLAGQHFPGLPSYRVVALAQQSLFGAGAGWQWLQYKLKAFGVLQRKGFQGQHGNEWIFVQIEGVKSVRQDWGFVWGLSLPLSMSQKINSHFRNAISGRF